MILSLSIKCEKDTDVFKGFELIWQSRYLNLKSESSLLLVKQTLSPSKNKRLFMGENILRI